MCAGSSGSLRLDRDHNVLGLGGVATVDSLRRRRGEMGRGDEATGAGIAEGILLRRVALA